MDRIQQVIRRAEAELRDRFVEIEENEEKRTAQVLDAFREEGVSYRHFAPTSGYGYDDLGRDTLERIYARIFHTEAALMRPHIASGTAALSLTLFAMSRSGGHILSATGMPYDTLQSVLGVCEHAPKGNLREEGREFSCVPLKDGKIDLEAVEKEIRENTTLVIAQRSRGYDWRPSLQPEAFRELAEWLHTRHPGIPLMADNCYGEFVCGAEPTDFGADLCVGSLIKNPGGGIAPTGGYVAGKKETVERIASRLTAPGLGRELGSYEGSYRPFYQGLFMAPHTVAQALKVALLTARVFENLGFETTPGSDEKRADIVQAVRMDSPERLVAYCQGIQHASPVDSMAAPEPWDMPGYEDPVVMAAGTFVAGASIELSADGPIRPPFTVYQQGGLTYIHGKIALADALTRMTENGSLIIDN